MTFPYEIHITVDASNNFDLGAFKTLCKILGVKPIVIDLEVNNETVLQDVMTSSHLFAGREVPIEQAKIIADELNNFGFEISRIKIETAPYHPDIPESGPSNGCYFETHIGINIPSKEDKDELDFFIKILSRKSEINQTPYNLHLSKNFFKRNENGAYKIMATMRSYDLSYEQFNKKTKEVCSRLILCGFEIDEPIIEYAIYDSNIHHDSKWINNGNI